MVRNNESWDLGEPEMNDRGQPVIHDIASKLGCIRPSPDLPFAFPEGAEDFADLQAQLQAARSELVSEDAGNRKLSDSSHSSPSLERTDRASSTESDHSDEDHHNQAFWSQHQQQMAARVQPPPINTSLSKPSPLKLVQRSSIDDDSLYSGRESFDTNCSVPSPVYTDFQTESPMFRNTSPFSPWSGGDDFLGQPHALDLTAQYMRAQQLHSVSRSSPLSGSMGGPIGLDLVPDVLKTLQMTDGLNFSDGTIRPNMLDCTTGFDVNDQMDIMYGGDYESQMGMA
jgi:hypothetical protein